MKVTRAFLVSLLMSGPVLADWTAISSKDFGMGKPPAIGSAAYKKDFEELHRLQDEREQSDCDLAASQPYPTYDGVFSDAGILTSAEYGKAQAVVSKVIKMSVRVAGYFKDEYQRPRPYDVDKTIKPCVKKPGGSK